MSGSTSSPRSSMSAGSDAGSSHSFSHYAQSSTRTTAPTSLQQLNQNSFTAGYTRSRTPPAADSRHVRTQSLPHLGSHQGSGNTTPKAQVRTGSSRLANSSTPHPPSDTEAADLMLFLATSPSPVRASTAKDKDARDLAAFRTLSGNPALKGRVLFPSSAGSKEDRAPQGAKALRRDGSGFSSTLTVATELIDDPVDGGSQEHVLVAASQSSPLNPNRSKRSRSASMNLTIPAPPTVIPPTPTEEDPVQLLPLPSSPTPAPRPRAEPLERSASAPAPAAAPSAPPTPGNTVPFNINDFINVSPSPATGSAAKLTSLRANVGRKLFEEHQTVGGSGSAAGHGGPGGLGAGIDLVRSSVM